MQTLSLPLPSALSAGLAAAKENELTAPAAVPVPAAADVPAWRACLAETDRPYNRVELAIYVACAVLVLVAVGYAGYQVWATMDGFDAAIRAMLAR